MIPIRDSAHSREIPLVTYTLIGLNCLIYAWDRGWGAAGHVNTFGDLTMRPNDIVSVLHGGDPALLSTLFTAMFLHGSLLHLIGNMLFLLAFGENVEHALGGVRFMLYYLFWGLVAWAAHIWVGPHSQVPTLGASGAIGGVLGCYFLLFPSHKITFIVPPLIFLPFRLAAWIILGFWFVFQIVLPQEGVANWAHAGGFLAGMLTVLIMGGPGKVREKTALIHDEEDSED